MNGIQYGVAIRILAFVLLLTANVSVSLGATPWDENYFPNTPLTTHDGKELHFFDDMIKGKIVAINFIYTSCPDVCPLETAQLIKVQKILGDRLGKDIFFYSISIDPDNDTPEVLSEYRSRFKAKWTFFTGNEADIKTLREKLGLYIDGIEKGENRKNHNVSMIIGNQKTGRWMRRSPFENPYVLADQLGHWLNGWKSAAKTSDYSTAPKLRNLSQGEQLFRTRCAACHTIEGDEKADAIGPDLKNVTQRRDLQWLGRWIQFPDKLLAEKDPIAMEMFKAYNNQPMPNLRLNNQEVSDVLKYLKTLVVVERPLTKMQKARLKKQHRNDKVAVNNAWIKLSHPKAKNLAGFFTLYNMGEDPVTIASIESHDFDKVELHEMSMANGMMEMNRIDNYLIPPSEKLLLESGGKHLMLINPKKAISAGDTIDIKLNFTSGSSQSIIMRVFEG